MICKIQFSRFDGFFLKNRALLQSSFGSHLELLGQTSTNVVSCNLFWSCQSKQCSVLFYKSFCKFVKLCLLLIRGFADFSSKLWFQASEDYIRLDGFWYSWSLTFCRSGRAFVQAEYSLQHVLCIYDQQTCNVFCRVLSTMVIRESIKIKLYLFYNGHLSCRLIQLFAFQFVK